MIWLQSELKGFYQQLSYLSNVVRKRSYLLNYLTAMNWEQLIFPSLLKITCLQILRNEASPYLLLILKHCYDSSWYLFELQFEYLLISNLVKVSSNLMNLNLLYFMKGYLTFLCSYYMEMLWPLSELHFLNLFQYYLFWVYQ